jgi:hypothetical protein
LALRLRFSPYVLVDGDRTERRRCLVVFNQVNPTSD